MERYNIFPEFAFFHFSHVLGILDSVLADFIAWGKMMSFLSRLTKRFMDWHLVIISNGLPALVIGG